MSTTQSRGGSTANSRSPTSNSNTRPPSTAASAAGRSASRTRKAAEPAVAGGAESPSLDQSKAASVKQLDEQYLKALKNERKRIQSAFRIFDRENKNAVAREHIGSIMRYLRAYVSDAELEKDVLPQLTEPDKPNVVQYEVFEPFMLRVIIEQLYTPDSEDTLLEAFKVLDRDNQGYLAESVIVDALKSGPFPFKDSEIEDFLRESKDAKTGVIDYTKYIDHCMSGKSKKVYV